MGLRLRGRGGSCPRFRLSSRGVALSAAMLFPVLADYARAVPLEALIRTTAHAASLGRWETKRRPPVFQRRPRCWPKGWRVRWPLLGLRSRRSFS